MSDPHCKDSIVFSPDTSPHPPAGAHLAVSISKCPHLRFLLHSKVTNGKLSFVIKTTLLKSLPLIQKAGLHLFSKCIEFL